MRPWDIQECVEEPVHLAEGHPELCVDDTNLRDVWCNPRQIEPLPKSTHVITAVRDQQATERGEWTVFWGDGVRVDKEIKKSGDAEVAEMGVAIRDGFVKSDIVKKEGYEGGSYRAENGGYGFVFD